MIQKQKKERQEDKSELDRLYQLLNELNARIKDKIKEIASLKEKMA